MMKSGAKRFAHTLYLLAQLGDLFVSAARGVARYVVDVVALVFIAADQRVLVAHDAAFGQAKPQSHVLIVDVHRLIQTLESGNWLLAEQESNAHVVKYFVAVCDKRGFVL